MRTLLICVFTAGQLLSQATAEETVYTWIDADGVTHFSDAPPAKANTAPGDVETMAMPGGFPETADTDGNYYSIVNQWKRMQEERADREELALERRRLRLEESRAEQAERHAATVAEAASAAANDTPAVVYGGGFHRPRHPGFHHRRDAFFGERGLQPGGHGGKFRRGHESVRPGHRQQNYVGNNSPGDSEPRYGFSLSVSQGL